MPKFIIDNPYKYPDVVISEQDGVRALHLGGGMIQSAMKLAAPNDLELGYTQCMMGFLLFHACPAKILMIGLGGGSLAKFVYHNMPETKTTVIENNAEVITAAQYHFALPDEDGQFEVILAEGGEYVTSHPLCADILMIDGFDDGCQVPSLCSQDFYNDTCKALNQNGILVVNLLSRDKNLNTYLKRIEQSFNGHVVSMLSEIRGNLIVFALKNSPGKLPWKVLKTRAKALEKRCPLLFLEFVEKLHKYNKCRGDYLQL